MKQFYLLLIAVIAFAQCAGLNAQTDKKASADIPKAPREFRGAWVATVSNIDWPSSPALSTEQQKSELVAILDKAVELNLNAIVFQVRPACDAMYDSKIEPWSEYLTGQQGKAPEPYYDPLKFIVEEAHKRGLELHTWFNPYRAWHPSAKSEPAPNHVSKAKPKITKSYGKHLWLDPGEKETREHTISVIMDVVNRYDIDGVHIDDYFYPYKEKDKDKKTIEFPDEASYKKYVDAGGTLQRNNWRRDNVNRFVERFYKDVKTAKSWVKVGISPFGIWKPGYPSQVKGFDQYEELYADAKLWLNRGWVDYWTPQLYWKTSSPEQSFPVLLAWWAGENKKERNLWPGLFTSRVSDREQSWPASEIVNQIKLTRAQPGATGDVHFSMKALMKNAGHINDYLTSPAQDIYCKTAIVPASPWLDKTAPAEPTVALKDSEDGSKLLSWKAGSNDKDIRWWLLSILTDGKWNYKTLPADKMSFEIKKDGDKPLPSMIAVSAINRVGNESPPTAQSIK